MGGVAAVVVGGCIQAVVKKKTIIDGAVKVESLSITDDMSSKVVSFFF